MIGAFESITADGVKPGGADEDLGRIHRQRLANGHSDRRC